MTQPLRRFSRNLPKSDPYVVCRRKPPMTHEEAMHAAQLKRAWADEALYVCSDETKQVLGVAGVLLESESVDLIQGEDDEEP